MKFIIEDSNTKLSAYTLKLSEEHQKGGDYNSFI